MRTRCSTPVTTRLLVATAAAGALCGLPLVVSGGAVATAAARPTCGGEPATVVGTGGDDRIKGTDGDDVVVALGGDDRIRGGRGHDLICGGTGVDVLRGGSGADRLVGGRGQTGFPDGELGNDRFVPGPGDDVVVVGPRQRRAALDRIDYSGIDRPVRADLRERRIEAQGEDRVVGTRSVRLIGSRHDDELRGSRADEELLGGDGADLLLGLGGADVLADGAGDDELRGGAGRDQLTGAAGDDELAGGKGNDSLSDFTHGSRRHDNGANALRGGQGRDDLTLAIAARAGHVLDGGPGRDSMYFETRRAGTRHWLMDLSTGVGTISGVEARSP